MRQRRIPAVIVTAGLLISISSFCSKKADHWKGRIETENGIKVVHNPKDPISPLDAPTLTSDLTLGQESDGPRAVVFRNLLPYGCVDTDAAGNIYVLDSGADTIFKFDARGGLLKSFGRKGQGPGEFQSANSMRIMPDGRITGPPFSGRTAVCMSSRKIRSAARSSGASASDGIRKRHNKRAFKAKES